MVVPIDRSSLIIARREFTLFAPFNDDVSGVLWKPDMSPAIFDRQRFYWALCESVTMLRRVA